MKKSGKIAMIAAPIVCACIAFAVVLATVIIPSQKLKKASILMESGDYEAAYKLLDGLDYKDSKEKRQEISERILLLRELLSCKIGDEICFGTYEQDSDLSNGSEDIEWIVLSKQGNKALLISKYALDCKPYNAECCSVTWETCSLRKWLNDDFLNAAFSASEQAMIPASSVSADKNPWGSADPGNATQDRIFLLSIPEVNWYFVSDSTRVCKPTAYAVASGVWTDARSEDCWWWLRSPGFNQDSAARVGGGTADVYYDGGVDEWGSAVNYAILAVRPALWINPES